MSCWSGNSALRTNTLKNSPPLPRGGRGAQMCVVGDDSTLVTPDSCGTSQPNDLDLTFRCWQTLATVCLWFKNCERGSLQVAGVLDVRGNGHPPHVCVALTSDLSASDITHPLRKGADVNHCCFLPHPLQVGMSWGDLYTVHTCMRGELSVLSWQPQSEDGLGACCVMYIDDRCPPPQCALSRHLWILLWLICWNNSCLCSTNQRGSCFCVWL